MWGKWNSSYRWNDTDVPEYFVEDQWMIKELLVDRLLVIIIMYLKF